LAAKIAKQTTGRNMILPGIAGMIFFLSILTFFDLNYFFYCFAVFGFAFSGGFFQVPCLATIQKSKSGRKLGDLFAYLNLSTFIFVLIGTFLFWITTYLTNQNSYAVFGVIYFICIITFINFNFRIKKHS
jgi:hypothetical protein